jgi:hypothetical protein
VEIDGSHMTALALLLLVLSLLLGFTLRAGFARAEIKI